MKGTQDSMMSGFHSVFWEKIRLEKILTLTAVFFETGAMPVPTKSRNPTICGSGDPFHSYLAQS